MANLCLLVRRSRLQPWPQLVAAITAAAPLLAQRLEGAQALWPKPLAIAAIPYGHVQPARDGLWRLGDQAAVIPSFAGDGLAIALHSAHAAAGALLAGQDARAFQAALARDLRVQVVGATVLSQLLVRPWSQGVLTAAARLNPGLLTLTARRTRIAPAVLRPLIPAAP